MARLNIDDIWFIDPRRKKLSELMGSDVLADGVAVSIWKYAQHFVALDVGSKSSHFDTSIEAETLGVIPKDNFLMMPGAKEFIEAKLARLTPCGVYICGSKDHFKWLISRRDAGRKGGSTCAVQAKTSKAKQEQAKTSKVKPLTLTLSLKKKNIKKKKIPDSILTILSHWNSKNISPNGHKSSDANLEKITKALKKKSEYTLDQTIQAITNYARVVNGPEFYFNYRWTLWLFLSRSGTDVFYPGNFIAENYIASQPGRPHQQSTPRRVPSGELAPMLDQNGQVIEIKVIPRRIK